MCYTFPGRVLRDSAHNFGNQVRLGQVGSGRVRSGQVRSGQVKSGQLARPNGSPVLGRTPFYTNRKTDCQGFQPKTYGRVACSATHCYHARQRDTNVGTAVCQSLLFVWDICRWNGAGSGFLYFFFASLLFPQPSLVQTVLLVSLHANEVHEGQKSRAHAGAYWSGGSRLKGGGPARVSARIWLQLG